MPGVLTHFMNIDTFQFDGLSGYIKEVQFLSIDFYIAFFNFNPAEANMKRYYFFFPVVGYGNQ